MKIKLAEFNNTEAFGAALDRNISELDKFIQKVNGKNEGIKPIELPDLIPGTGTTPEQQKFLEE